MNYRLIRIAGSVSSEFLIDYKLCTIWQYLYNIHFDGIFVCVMNCIFLDDIRFPHEAFEGFFF